MLPFNQAAFGAATGHSGYGSTRGRASTERSTPVAASACARSWYSCTMISRPSGSQQLSRNIASTSNIPSSTQTSIRRARRMAMSGWSPSSCQPNGSAGSARGGASATFSLMPLRVPSGCSALDPGRNPEQMPTILGPGAFASRSRNSGTCSAQRNQANPAIRVAPARSSSRRCSGVPASTSCGISEAMEVRRFPPARHPTSRSRPSGAGSASISVMSRSTTGQCDKPGLGEDTGLALAGAVLLGVSRSRARPSRRRSATEPPSSRSPPGHDMSMVEVRRTEPARRAGGAGAGSRGAGGRGEAAARSRDAGRAALMPTRHPVRKPCFHRSRLCGPP